MINSPLIDKGKGEEKPLTESDLVTVHHRFMMVYGWISLEEFKSLPLPTLFSLMEEVNKEYFKREEFRLFMLKFAGVKDPK